MSHPLWYTKRMKMKNENTKKVTSLRRDDLPTVEQNARLFRSLDRLQAKRLERQERFAKMSEDEFWDLERNI